MAPDLTITMSLPMVLAAAIMKPPNAPPAFLESIEVHVPFKCVSVTLYVSRSVPSLSNLP